MPGTHLIKAGSTPGSCDHTQKTHFKSYLNPGPPEEEIKALIQLSHVSILVLSQPSFLLNEICEDATNNNSEDAQTGDGHLTLWVGTLPGGCQGLMS